MIEPASFADLTGEKGWARVDYKRTRWIRCLAAMPDGYDTGRWAREFSAAWWSMAGLPHGETELTRLETQLAYIRDYSFGRLPFHMAFIHLPEPRLDPMPVYVAILASRGERAEQLKALTFIDDPLAIRPPIVEEFTTDRLVSGLSVLRLCTATPDLGRLQAASGDIDELARQISFSH